MLKIETGLETRALKVVIYGAEGIGKSTFASQFPNPLFLDTEGGTSSLNVRRVKCGKDWSYLAWTGMMSSNTMAMVQHLK